MTNAGAGWFSAELPALTGFQQFFIVATNALGSRASFPDDAPSRECNLRYGEASVSGALGQYHLWVSKTNVTRWTRRAKLANELIDTTFVYGSNRVIYNAGSQYSGSPFHAPSYDSPTGANCDYVLVAPPDDRFLGEEELNLLQPGNGGGDGTGQAEQHAYWIADQLGLPHCHRRPILLWFNGVKRGVVYEDAQQPNSDFIKQWFPDDSGGELHKIQLWFEFEADGSTFTQIGADLGNYLSRGKKKLARYRWTWPLRGFGNYPNNYTNIYNLVDAVNARETGDRYVHVLEQATDVSEWFHTHVTEHLVGNNDSYSYGGGQNMYAYLPQHGPWQLLIWDIDFAFSAGGPTEDMVMIGGPTVGPVNTNPTFSRKYYQAMLDAVNGPLMTNRYQPILDSRFAGLRSQGASGVASPSGIKSYLKIRRDSLLRQLTNGSPALSLSAALTNGVTSSANLVTLTGTAPLNARILTLNGEPIPVTWTTRTAWTAKVPFPTGSNTFVLSGLDAVGLPITNPPVPVVVVVTGITESPVGRIVFTEILPTPRWLGGATWIELQNLSITTAFDLSGWRIEGINYTLPVGTFLAPSERIVIPSDRFVFNQTYGTQLRVAGEFSGQLDPFGETLKLVQPGVILGQDVIIDEVRYSTLTPWPTPLPGYSLQLIDSSQDPRRAANWLTANQNGGSPDLGPPATPGLANTGAHPLPPLAPLALNELMVENTETLRDNLGRFRPWVELYNDSDKDQVLTHCFLSPTPVNLAAWSFPAEAVVPAHGFLIVWLDGDTAASTATAPHTDFVVGSSGFLALNQQVEDRIGTLDSIDFESPGPDRSFGDFPDGDLLQRHSFSTPTPSATNTLRVPNNSVFINEWLADNRTTLADPADGKFEDWFELYNAGDRPIHLAGYYVGNSLTNVRTFAIPPGYVLAAGGRLLVWADREPEQNLPARGDLHANFKLSKNGGAITFANPDGILLDAVSFGIQLPDISQGREPDGGNYIGILSPPTPRLENPPAPPRFTTGIIVDEQLALGFVGLPLRKYRIENRISLAFAGGPWEALGTSVTDAQGHGSYSAIRSPNSLIAFFRLVLVP